MNTQQGAHVLIEALIREVVDTIFGYPGGSIMPAYDALFDHTDRLRHVLVRHEQGAAHAAEGYAQATGKTGVCMVTSGPGATNLLTGIANAMMDSTPIVCITGQVAEALLGTDAFQESPILGMATPVTKWCIQVTRAEDIAPTIERGFRIAKAGRPGPVLIDITKNALLDTCAPPPSTTHKVLSRKTPAPHAIEQAAALLNTAERPYVLVGHGVLISEAEDALRTFVDHGTLPFAATLLGLGAIESTHPLFQGMLGMHGNYTANLHINKADVILAIGMRFDDRVTGKVSEFAPHAKIIHIDLDPAEVGKIIHPEVTIVADARMALEALTPHIQKKHRDVWLASFRTLDRKEDVVRSEVLSPPGPELTMGEVVRALEEQTLGSAVIVADVGQHQMMTARYYRVARTGRFITSGGLGTMGFALPAAIGAQVGRPDKTVVAIMGDGSAQMNIQELGTIMQAKVPVKIIILNNGFLGMVRQWQELFFDKRYSGVDIESPDFVALAQAYHIDAAQVRERSDLNDTLRTCLTSDGSYLLEVMVRKEENVFPMVPGGASLNDIRLS